MIAADNLGDVNALLSDPNHPLMKGVKDIIRRYGTPEQINRKAAEAGTLESLMNRLEEGGYSQLTDLRWLIEQRDRGAFVSTIEFQSAVSRRAAGAGSKDPSPAVSGENAVTLEISPLQYFPWLIEQAEQAIANKEIMPARYIRLRKMKEQEQDGDLPAVRAAMKVLGASCVESPETSGADGSNIHLGGPDTIAGYYGGIGAPNDYPLKWLDEVLYYYTEYGITEFINVSYGTMFAAILAHSHGVDIGIKISVTQGHDNPYHVFWSLMTAKLFSRSDGSTPFVGLNLSNSVDDETIRAVSRIRADLGLEKGVRIEHHITEPWLGVVRQPYLRRDQLLRVAGDVPNISAKHEGGEPEVEARRDHPSNHQENFRTMDEITAAGELDAMKQNYLDKHDSLNRTARALADAGLPFIGAPNLHGRG